MDSEVRSETWASSLTILKESQSIVDSTQECRLTVCARRPSHH